MVTSFWHWFDLVAFPWQPIISWHSFDLDKICISHQSVVHLLDWIRSKLKYFTEKKPFSHMIWNTQRLMVIELELGRIFVTVLQTVLQAMVWRDSIMFKPLIRFESQWGIFILNTVTLSVRERHVNQRIGST